MIASTKRPVHELAITWILLVPMLFFIVRGAFSLDRTQSNNELVFSTGRLLDTGSGAAYYRFEQATVYALISSLMLLAGNHVSHRLWNNKPILLLPAIAIVSTFWSQSPLSTLSYSVFTILLTAFGAYISIRFSPQRILQMLIFIGAITIILCFFTVAFFPTAGIEHLDNKRAWEGIFSHKNHCAIVMTYLLMPIISMRHHSLSVMRTIFNAVYILSTLVLVFMTQSRTGWILLIFSFCFVSTVRIVGLFRAKERYLFILIAPTVLLIASYVGISNAGQIALLFGKDVTLTGRTQIWSAILHSLWNKPLLGAGYMAFWLGLKGDSANLLLSVGTGALNNAENAVFQIWLELGAVGVAFLLIVIFLSCKNAAICLRQKPSDFVYWCVMIIFLTVMSLVNGDKFMYPHTIEWLLYVIAYIGLADEARSIRSLKAA